VSTDHPARSRIAQPATPRPRPYERIKEAILSGEFVAGQPLVEATLAEWCGVSRTPIRQALTRLVEDGLAIRGERGLIVRESRPAEILDIYETRIALEGTAARMAAERRTSNDLLVMRRMAEEMAALAPGDPDLMTGANSRFHRAIWQASRNESLIDVLERLSLHLRRYPADTLGYPDRWDTSNHEHNELIDAIEGRRVDDAGEIARKHFSVARDIRVKLWVSRGDY
jgi:DNA-binding GntR family transcriptional regulator